MPIPNLTDDGYLPVGVHECSLDEIESVFGQFQHSRQRCDLYNKLEDFVAEARLTGMIVAVIVNGSFASAQDEPGDIDLIVILSDGHDFSAELRPFEYNVLSRRRTRKHYGFDVLIAQQNQTELEEYKAFFAQIRGDSTRQKGMLKVVL